MTSIPIHPSDHERLDRFVLLTERIALEISGLGGNAEPRLLSAHDTLRQESHREQRALIDKVQGRTGQRHFLRVTVSLDEVEGVSLADALRVAAYWRQRRLRQRHADRSARVRKLEKEINAWRRGGFVPPSWATQELASRRREVAALQNHICASPGSQDTSRTTPRSRNVGRPRGRRSARRASLRSNDSGDGSGSSEPPGHPGRLCSCGCGRAIPEIDAAGRKTRTDRKTFDASCRKRVERRDGSQSETEFRDPYLRPDAPGDELAGLTRDGVRERVKAACRCNGHHILDGRDGDCIKCGHPYKAAPPDYLGLWARDKSGSGELGRGSVIHVRNVARLRSARKMVAA